MTGVNQWFEWIALFNLLLPVLITYETKIVTSSSFKSRFWNQIEWIEVTSLFKLTVECRYLKIPIDDQLSITSCDLHQSRWKYCRCWIMKIDITFYISQCTSSDKSLMEINKIFCVFTVIWICQCYNGIVIQYIVLSIGCLWVLTSQCIIYLNGHNMFINTVQPVIHWGTKVMHNLHGQV